MTSATGASIATIPIKFQAYINPNKIPKEIFPALSKEPTTGVSSHIFQQLLTQTKSKGSRDWNKEGLVKVSTKSTDDARHKMRGTNIDRAKNSQSPAGEGSTRGKNTPLKGYQANRNRMGYDQRNSFFVNTPTLTCSGISGSFERPSKNYLSTSIVETNPATQPGDIVSKALRKSHFENDAIDESDNKKTKNLTDDLKKEIDKVIEQGRLQIKYRSNNTPLREIGSQRPLRRERTQSTMRLKDFYLLRESPTKQGLSQQFLKGPTSKDNFDSAKKSMRFIDTPKEVSAVAARSMRHVKSISGHYIQIKGPVNQDTEAYHMPISRFNQTISDKEARNMLKSISYFNSRKQSESRDNSNKEIEYKSSGVDRSFKGNINTNQSTVVLETKENNYDIIKSKMREDQENKGIRAWRVSCVTNKDWRKGEASIAEKRGEKQEVEDTESRLEPDYKLEDAEEIIDSDRPRNALIVTADRNNNQDEEDQKEDMKPTEPVSVDRRREILLSYKNKKSGLFINHQKVTFSSYIKAMDPSKNRNESTKSKEDPSQDIIRPLERNNQFGL